MNVLTNDIISVIVTRKYSIIKCDFWWQCTRILYINQSENLHRINGPALIYNDDWLWCFNGNWHRIDKTKPTEKVNCCYKWCNMNKLVAERKIEK